MGQYKKLWFLLFAVLAVCFTILGYMGSEVYKKAPPYPEKIVSSSGQVLMTKDDILAGQSAWQTTGGMEVGSVLGTRCVSGTRLDGRLAAPRIGRLVGSYRSERLR